MQSILSTLFGRWQQWRGLSLSVLQQLVCLRHQHRLQKGYTVKTRKTQLYIRKMEYGLTYGWNTRNKQHSLHLKFNVSSKNCYYFPFPPPGGVRGDGISFCNCGRPLLFVANWKYFYSSLPVDAGYRMMIVLWCVLILPVEAKLQFYFIALKILLTQTKDHFLLAVLVNKIKQLALTSQTTSWPSTPLVENFSHFAFVPEWRLTWLHTYNDINVSLTHSCHQHSTRLH